MQVGVIRGMLTAAAALLCFATVSHAADGDPTRGQKKFYTCLGCHGVEGYHNAYPTYHVPRLRHQHAAYIIAALNEYKAGQRPHPTMHAQAWSMNDQDIADIAAFLQGEPTKPNTDVVGTKPAQADACAACHGVNGTGVDAPLEPKPPVLAGQHYDYLLQAIDSYRLGRRKNAVMNGMAGALQTEADVEALARYFADQKSPLTAVPRK
ncbi:MAG: cytochrome c4 [Proteobacteria bacterium]|nr:cytochrome c4 [Pseudomonadota bacterium]